jgi:hypothetical protein
MAALAAAGAHSCRPEAGVEGATRGDPNEAPNMLRADCTSGVCWTEAAGGPSAVETSLVTAAAAAGNLGAAGTGGT